MSTNVCMCVCVCVCVCVVDIGYKCVATRIFRDTSSRFLPTNFVDRRIYERDSGSLKKNNKEDMMWEREDSSQPRRRSRRRYLLLGPMSVI